MATRFFDTSALQHRYIDGEHSQTVRQIVSDKRYHCVIAEPTVLEIASAIANRCRRGRKRQERYVKADVLFFQDLAAKRLSVQNAGKREVIHARGLLRYAVLVKGRSLGGWDALIAACAREYALTAGEKVTLYTCDWRMYDILRKIGSYSKVLNLRYLGQPKNGGS